MSRVDTNYNRRTRLDNSLAELWSRAAHFGMSHAAILTEAAAIRERLGYSKLTRADQAWLSGRDSLRMDYAFRHDLVWTLAERDGGVFIGSWDALTESEREKYRSHYMSGWHRWKTNNRTFSVDKELRRFGLA